MKGKLQALSPSEREVLKVLWDEGPGTVRAINAALKRGGRRWVYTTVQTLLNRLQAKGYVTCDKSGFAHVFHAAVARETIVEQGLADLADQFCDGTAVPLVLALVQGHRFSTEDIDRFRKLLDELEGKESRRKGRRSRTRKT